MSPYHRINVNVHRKKKKERKKEDANNVVYVEKDYCKRPRATKRGYERLFIQGKKLDI